jgi:hypothetical protein
MRGGYRPNAGRPRTSALPAKDVAKRAQAPWLSPLDYMLAVMRDPKADPARRDRMAIAAATYRHAPVADTGWEQ